MQKVYLSLNQGGTFFRESLNDLGEINSIGALSISAKVIRHLLGNIPENINLEKIDLKSKRKSAKGYIEGHITGVGYNFYKLFFIEQPIDCFMTYSHSILFGKVNV